LFSPTVERQFPHLVGYSNVNDVGKAAKDWPDLNFIVYHSAYRWVGGVPPAEGRAQWERTRRVEWTNDLADIPAQYGVKDVYRDLRQIFGWASAGQARARQSPRRRPRAVGHRLALDRRAAVADRGAAPARDPGGHAEEVRLRAARRSQRPGQERHLRPEQREALQLHAEAAGGGADRPARALQGNL